MDTLEDRINYRMRLHYPNEEYVKAWWTYKNYLLDGLSPREMLELDRGEEFLQLIKDTIGDGE